MPSTYVPTGKEAQAALDYGKKGRKLLDDDLVKSTNLLDERIAPAYQTKLQSEYLNDLTKTDSPYLKNIELKALEGAAARGQFNSSIGVGSAMREGIDAAAKLAEGDATVGMANTLASNTRANKEYDAFTSLNKAGYDNKTTMLFDSIDAANLFNQNDMTAMVNKGTAYDTQQYGIENKGIDQMYLMDAKAQDQADSLIKKEVDHRYLMDAKAVTHANLKESDAWTQEDKEDTLDLEQKYDYQDRADKWIYDAKDLEKRNQYIQEQDNNKHKNTLEADVKKYAHEGFMETLRQYGGIQQQFIAGYSQIQSSEIPASQKQTNIRLLFNQTQGAMGAMASYSKTGTVPTATYNETGVESTYEPGETAAQRDFDEVNAKINEIYGEVRVGGGDSPQELLIDSYRNSTRGLTEYELREITRIYSENGLTNDNWEDVVTEMTQMGQKIQADKEEANPTFDFTRDSDHISW